MARHKFGGAIADWTFTVGGSNEATLAGGSTVTFWDDSTGGTQYTDLSEDADGTLPMDHVTSADGTGVPAIGQIPEFYGPDEVWHMWAEAGGGPRAVIVATDVGDQVAIAQAGVTSNATTIASHIAAANPHATRVDDLADVDASAPADGDALVYDSASGQWLAGEVPGLTDVVTLSGDQSITGTKTMMPLDPAETALTIQCATGQSNDVLAVFSDAGNRTTYLNELGELRVIAGNSSTVPMRIKGRNSGQTGDLTQWTDVDNNELAWVDPQGRVRAPNLGHTLALSVDGTVAVGAGSHRIYNDTGVALTIRSVRATVGTAPTGAALIVDVNRNGTTIFTTQSNRPTVTAGSNTSGKVTAVNTTTLNDGDYLTVDVDQVGSTVAGANLVVQVLAY